MKKICFYALCTLLSVGCKVSHQSSENKNRKKEKTTIDSLAPNPFIRHMYTAAPSARVWDDGRLFPVFIRFKYRIGRRVFRIIKYPLQRSALNQKVIDEQLSACGYIHHLGFVHQIERRHSTAYLGRVRTSCRP